MYLLFKKKKKYPAINFAVNILIEITKKSLLFLNNIKELNNYYRDNASQPVAYLF